MQDELNQRTAELKSKRREIQEVERQLQSMTGDFDSLQVKYEKLIRPARTSEGHDLIEVRYWKANGEYRISWREGSSGEFQSITRKRLDAVLTRLKRERKNGLFVRVIFPEDAGLSYDEAWEFTSHLHGNYDYYFSE